MAKIKYGFLCFIPNLVYIIFNSMIPQEIVGHISGLGNVTYVNKWSFVLFTTLAGFVCHCLYMIISLKKPDWIGKKKIGKYSHWYFPILTNVVSLIGVCIS